MKFDSNKYKRPIINNTETSPQPYGIYQVLPELTPSSQILPTSSAYTQIITSPYHTSTTVPLISQSNKLLISPNHKYNTGGGSNHLPAPMGRTDYSAFDQLTQQQYLGYNFADAGTTHLETKFYQTAAVESNHISNLNNANMIKMHNLLIPTNSTNVTRDGASVTDWNVTSNHYHHNLHHMQQQYSHQTPIDANNTNAGVSDIAVNATDATNGNNANNSNYNEHGLSNLLTFDSEQLVRINSEDQHMLQLNSEDLQISNLSIST